ncbi:MAG: hypothetical protein J6N54_03805, partial [Bacteroidales bacterium]|nr:hypothetical protein [Bacteroidales bacterium]
MSTSLPSILSDPMKLDWFVAESYEEDGDTKLRLKLNPKYAGMYADGWISAAGISDDGGGHGAYTLPQLNDVDDDIYTGISAGKALVWDGSKWTAGSVATDLSGYLPLTAGSGKPLTGALHLSTGSSAADTTKGLNINNAHIGSTGNLLGLYSAGTIVLRPGGSTTDGLELTESAITFNGSALLTRAVADPLYLDKLIYLNGNTSGYGVLVKTNLRASSGRQPVFHITGNPYSGSRPIDTWVTFYNYLSTTSSMNGVRVVHNGYDLGDIHAFNYNHDDTSSPASGFIYLWFDRPARYATIAVSCWNAHGGNYPYNLVDTVTYAPMPDTALMARHSVIRSGTAGGYLRKTYPAIASALRQEGWYRIGHYSGQSSGYEITFGSSYSAQVAQWVKLFVHGQSSSGAQMRQIEVLGSNANTMLTKARVVYESATVM